MYKSRYKQFTIIGKALLFMGVYLIQLFCYQDLIVAATNPHDANLRKSFTPSQPDNNSVISVFRTLEKHCEFGKETSTKKSITETVSCYPVLAVVLTPNLAVANKHTLPLLLSEVSYKRYLSVNVFRI